MIPLQTIQRAWLVALLSLLHWVPAARAAGELSPSEYQVKATFLFNFTRFVEWPATAFLSPGAPLVIGIVGDDPFQDTLDQLVRGEAVHGHALLVKRYRSDQELSGCHVLFVARSERPRLGELLNRAQTYPILTVADGDGLGEEGVMINLVLVDGRVKMEINRQAAERAALQISSRLLSLARIVTTRSTPARR